MPTTASQKRRPRRRSNGTPSQRTVTKRMREMFSEGFQWHPLGLPTKDAQKVREAMRALVEDDAYWEAVARAAELKNQAREVLDAVK